jgi:hypothetical protein
MARDVTMLITQQDEIEKLFVSNKEEEGINKFFSYTQQFKSLENIKIKI